MFRNIVLAVALMTVAVSAAMADDHRGRGHRGGGWNQSHRTTVVHYDYCPRVVVERYYPTTTYHVGFWSWSVVCATPVVVYSTPVVYQPAPPVYRQQVVIRDYRGSGHREAPAFRGSGHSGGRRH